MNVFVVRSPYAYINALELRNKFKMLPEECYLLVGYAQRNDIDVQHFEQLFRKNDWAGMAYYCKNASVAYQEWAKPRRKISEFLFKIFFLKKYVSDINSLLPDKSSVSNVIVQNIDDYSFLHIANVLNPKKVYCLDEGPRSLWTKKLRKKAHTERSAHNFIQTFKRKMMDIFWGYRVSPIRNATFFSCYDLPIEAGESLVRHSFEYLRESALQLPRDDSSVYFIGSSLSEVGVVTEEYYLVSLETIARFFAPKKVIYIAHRGDSIDKLNKIENDLGVEVKSYNIPFELQLAMFGPVPACIASFYSSVLVNCAEMFQSTLQVTSFRIPTRELSLKHRAQIESVYSYFQDRVSSSFSVVKMQ